MHVLMTENQVGGEELYILRKKFPLPTTIYVFVTGNSKFQVVSALIPIMTPYIGIWRRISNIIALMPSSQCKQDLFIE